MLYLQGTPTELASFALFLFRKCSTILFWAQINAIRMLQGSNHPVRTFVFRNFFSDFSDFYVHKCPVRKARLPNRYLLLCFDSWNTVCQHSGFSHYFVILRIFTNIEPLYVRRIHLTGIYYFVFVYRIRPKPFQAQIEAIKMIQGSIRPTNAPVYHLFFGLLSNFAII